MTDKKSRFFFSWCLILWLVNFLFLKYMLEFLPGIGIDDLLDDFSFSATQVGLLAGMYFYPYLLLQIPAGFIVDRCRVSKVTFVALSFCVIGMLIFSFATQFSSLLLARLLIGIGVAFSTAAYMRAAATYFSPQWFSRLAGYFGTACMGGAGCTILILGWVYIRFGWQNLLIATSIFSIILMMFSLYFIKQENKLDKQHVPIPAKSITHSGVTRSLIPIKGDHVFRFMPIGAKRRSDSITVDNVCQL